MATGFTIAGHVDLKSLARPRWRGLVARGLTDEQYVVSFVSSGSNKRGLRLRLELQQGITIESESVIVTVGAAAKGQRVTRYDQEGRAPVVLASRISTRRANTFEFVVLPGWSRKRREFKKVLDLTFVLHGVSSRVVESESGGSLAKAT